ncbi:GntR family transcriptional regulator [Nocardia sp. NPDC051570]|uniref:GntR family transcriptional regulator n=1 Tax=Nocardia sp. NPDC051570 TaxID=3364324 RepID=UPI0037B5494D
MTTSPTNRATAAAIAVDLITAIYNGHYQPGDKLPSQTQIMTTYGVAMATAAAALRKLRDHGLTTTQPGRGIYLTTQLPHSDPSQYWLQRYADITTLYHAADHLNALAEQTEQVEQAEQEALSPTTKPIRSPLHNLHPTILQTLAEALTTTAHHIINHGPTPTTHATIAAAHHILTHDGNRQNQKC